MSKTRKTEVPKPVLWSGARVLDAINRGGTDQVPLVKPLKRQAFYKTLMPQFAARGLVSDIGRKKYVIVGLEDDPQPSLLVTQWQHYARYRERMIANGDWIGRTPWTWDAMLACQNAPIPTLRPDAVTDEGDTRPEQHLDQGGAGA